MYSQLSTDLSFENSYLQLSPRTKIAARACCTSQFSNVPILLHAMTEEMTFEHLYLPSSTRTGHLQCPLQSGAWSEVCSCICMVIVQQTWDMTQLDVTFIYEMTYSDTTCVTGVCSCICAHEYMCTCDMTHSDVTWLIHVWHDSFMCDMTHSCVTWLIHMCTCHMTHSRTWMSHITSECVISRVNESCRIWMSHVTYGWVISQVNESCPIPQAAAQESVIWLYHFGRVEMKKPTGLINKTNTA